MDNAIWSAQLARRIAETIGYTYSGAPSAADAIPLRAEKEKIIREVTEAFRYLAPESIQCALDFAEFLRGKIEGEPASLSIRQNRMEETLAEVRDLVLFLRSRYGEEQPTDEKDYWTDEDREEARAQSHRRLEERDPYPNEEIEDAHAG